MDLAFPEEGLVYDYRLDDGGVSRTGKSDEDEDEDKKSFKVWLTGNPCVHVCVHV